MEYYFDIQAIPNSEIIQSEVIAVFIQKLHLMLPDYEGRVGIDFPKFRNTGTPGGIIRLLGTKTDIENIYIQVNANNVFTNYSLISEFKKVPEKVNRFVKYQRFHTGGGNSRIKRLEKRHKERGTWTQKLAEAVSNNYNQKIDLPYLNLKSCRSGKNFKLFIKEYKAEQLLEGKFNAYGLSLGEATIPKF